MEAQSKNELSKKENIVILRFCFLDINLHLFCHIDYTHPILYINVLLFDVKNRMSALWWQDFFFFFLVCHVPLI